MVWDKLHGSGINGREGLRSKLPGEGKKNDPTRVLGKSKTIKTL
jgi:hypothetical protein